MSEARTLGIGAIACAAPTAMGLLSTSAVAGGDHLEDKELGLKIPDGHGRATTKINMDDAHAVGDVIVSLRVKHPRTKDLKLTLTSPSGTKVTLTNRDTTGADLGTGNHCEGNRTHFRDIGADLSNGTAPYDGVFKPAQQLGALEAEPIDGQWKLTAKDLKGGKRGKLKCFGMNVYWGTG